jgi:hypothetical protein
MFAKKLNSLDTDSGGVLKVSQHLEASDYVWCWSVLEVSSWGQIGLDTLEDSRYIV